MRITQLPSASLPTTSPIYNTSLAIDSSGNGTQKIDVNDMLKLTNAVSATDLNDCTYCGLYRFDTSTLHAPISGYGIVQTISTNMPQSTGTGWIIQYGFSTTGFIYIRTKINVGGSWSSWRIVDYPYATLTCTFTGDVDSASAYTESGMVVLRVNMKAGLAGGWHNTSTISIGSSSTFLPRMEIDGTRRINAGADASVNAFCSLSSSGSFVMYTSGGSTGLLPFYFCYPIRTY